MGRLRIITASVGDELTMKYSAVRNRIARKLANTALMIATPEYRDFIEGAIRYGMNAAADDEIRGRPAPVDWEYLLDDDRG
jgi:hypothetical protein